MPDVAGFSSGDVPAPPETVCHDGSYHEDYVPVLPGSLGQPTAVGYRTEDAELHAWGWRLASADAATAVVDEAVADLGGCSYEIHFDSDTDGDGELDAGGSEQQSAQPFSDDSWTGMSSSGHFYGDGAELVESRFVRSGDVVLLVVLTIHGGGDDSLRSAVATYLDGVAAELT
jgi:hypothetical protein